MSQVKRYKLTTRYEIRAVTIDTDEPHPYERMTDERLSIEDTIDLADAVTLTRVLTMLDRIHETVMESIKS